MGHVTFILDRLILLIQDSGPHDIHFRQIDFVNPRFLSKGSR